VSFTSRARILIKGVFLRKAFALQITKIAPNRNEKLDKGGIEHMLGTGITTAAMFCYICFTEEKNSLKVVRKNKCPLIYRKYGYSHPN
jgi:hypothetical protein